MIDVIQLPNPWKEPFVQCYSSAIIPTTTHATAPIGPIIPHQWTHLATLSAIRTSICGRRTRQICSAPPTSLMHLQLCEAACSKNGPSGYGGAKVGSGTLCNSGGAAFAIPDRKHFRQRRAESDYSLQSDLLNTYPLLFLAVPMLSMRPGAERHQVEAGPGIGSTLTLGGHGPG